MLFFYFTWEVFKVNTAQSSNNNKNNNKFLSCSLTLLQLHGELPDVASRVLVVGLRLRVAEQHVSGAFWYPGETTGGGATGNSYVKLVCFWLSVPTCCRFLLSMLPKPRSPPLIWAR